jgi:hypothetical protein
VPVPRPAPAAVAADPVDQALLDWCRRLPKIELHLHLEGLAERFRYRDFAHFIDVWSRKNHFLREYDDFTWWPRRSPAPWPPSGSATPRRSSRPATSPATAWPSSR